MKEKENKIKWYESGNVITTLIIVTILGAIFCSQSFAVVGTGASRSTSGGTAYVMIPDDDSVNQAKAMINTVVSGGILEDTEAAE